MSSASAASHTWLRMNFPSRERSLVTISVNRGALAGMVTWVRGGGPARASIVGRRMGAGNIVGGGAVVVEVPREGGLAVSSVRPVVQERQDSLTRRPGPSVWQA